MNQPSLQGAAALAPLLRAVFRVPGLSSDSAALAEATARISALHRDVLSHVVEVVGDQRAKNALAEPLAKLVAETWMDNPHNVQAGRIAESFLALLPHARPLPDQAFAAGPRFDADSLAQARATAHLLPTVLSLSQLKGSGMQLFFGKLSQDEALELLREDLRRRCQEVADRQAPAEARSECAKAVLDILGPVYGQALSTEFNAIGRKFKGMIDDQKRQYVADLPNHPQGPLFERVTAAMDKAVEALFPPQSMAETPMDEHSPRP